MRILNSLSSRGRNYRFLVREQKNLFLEVLKETTCLCLTPYN